MPVKPKRPCRHPGCHALVSNGYCEKHKPKETPRLSSSQRGYDYQWRKESKAFLTGHPFCNICKTELATEVDHITPHKGNPVLFWNQDNWQGLCHSCHSVKTAKEDGGFGNERPPGSKKYSKNVS